MLSDNYQISEVEVHTKKHSLEKYTRLQAVFAKDTGSSITNFCRLMALKMCTSQRVFFFFK